MHETKIIIVKLIRSCFNFDDIPVDFILALLNYVWSILKHQIIFQNFMSFYGYFDKHHFLFCFEILEMNVQFEKDLPDKYSDF